MEISILFFNPSLSNIQLSLKPCIVPVATLDRPPASVLTLLLSVQIIIDHSVIDNIDICNKSSTVDIK